MAVAALAAIAFLPSPALRVMVVVLSLGALRELLGIVRSDAEARSRATVSAVAAALFTAAVCWTWSGAAPRADLLLLVALAVVLIEVLWAGRTFGDAATTVAAGIYVGLPLGALAAVHAIGGRDAVLLLLGSVVVSDSSQYYTGRLLGRHLLAPTISPKKTIEGAVGGLLFGTTAMVLGGRVVLPDVGTAALAAVGLVVVLLGICGDLFESRLKRTAGVKDSSNLIPGHGGVLDRIDALLFATPAFYLAVRTWL